MKRLISVLILSMSLVFAHPVFAKGFGGASVSARPAMTYRAPAVAPRVAPAPAPKVASTPSTPAASAASSTATTSASSSSSGWMAWLPAWLLLTSSSSNASDCGKDKKDCK